MFIATNYVMEYYPKHNISPVLPVKPLVMDTLQITDRVHFNQISKVLNIPVEDLRILNPSSGQTLYQALRSRLTRLSFPPSRFMLI